MDQLGSLIQKQNFPASERQYKPMSEEERLSKEIELYNDSIGDLNDDGIDCPLCKNKGYIMKNIKGYKTLVTCKCMIGRRNKSLIRKSGLGRLISLYTMDTYMCTASWQTNIKALALRFSDQGYKNNWFFTGGQPGSGKTHICTGILGVLIDKGIEVRYFLWRDEIVKIKASFGDGASDALDVWKKVPVLYIDDFFKSDTKPTVTDVNLAFEILNYRYNNNLSTIISTEYCIDTILSIDEAIGSRIFQMAGDYCINIAKDVTRNKRLKAK